MQLPSQVFFSSLYIHIPFCSKICPFCAFAIEKDSPSAHHKYLKSLELELSYYFENYEIDPKQLKSIYLGGGTPSRLTIQELEYLISILEKYFNLNTLEQFSIELNPEDCSVNYLNGINSLPINRLSVGIQTFSETSLKTLGRIHNEKQSKEALENIHTVGFENFNLDLMFGFLHQTIRDLEKDLSYFIASGAKHISTYCLNLEEKTPFGKSKKWNRWVDQNEKLHTEMYSMVCEVLGKNSYQQYEVSNFSKKGFASLNNTLVWKGENFLGIGSGAHSFVHPIRFGNVRSSIEYTELLQQKKLSYEFFDSLNKKQLLEESLMVQLRLEDGLQLDKISNDFSLSTNLLHNLLSPLQKEELIIKHKTKLQLTLKGKLLADEITTWLVSKMENAHS